MRRNWTIDRTPRTAFACMIALALMLLALSGLRPAAAAEKVIYLLPAPVQLSAFGPWVIAKARGYYAKAGYDVEFQVAHGGVDVAKQVGVGNAPIGGALGDTSIIVRSNGVPVRTVALLGGGSLMVVVARKDRGIRAVKDLKGKTIGVLSYQDTTYYALLGMLASVGLTKSDANIQAVGPSAITSLVIAGKADACACTPDWEILVENGVKDGTVAMPSNRYFPAMAQAIVASDSEIKTNPKLVDAIVRATLDGMKAIMDNPATAAKTFADAPPSWKGKEALLTRIFANFVERSYKGQRVLGAMDPVRLAKLQDFYLKQGLIERATPVAELYTNRFVEK